jgi:protein-tyrosine phosphatase
VNVYVDLHSHVLPGIDDGPADLDAALAMLRVAAGYGTAMIPAGWAASYACAGSR